MTRRWAGLLAVNLAAMIFGSAALFGKLEAGPVWIVAGRTAFAALALAAILLARGRLDKIGRAEFGRAAGTAALLALHWVAFFAAVQMAGVAIATLTVSAFPLFTILMHAVRRGRPPTLVEMGAGAAIIIAIGLVTGPGLPATNGAFAGAMMGLFSAASFALFALLSQNLVGRLGAMRLALCQYGVATLLLLPLLPFSAPMAGASQWIAVAVLGIVGTALAHQLYLFSLDRLPAAVCGAIASLEPVYAIAFAAVLFVEPFGPLVPLSASMIVGASWLLLRTSSPLHQRNGFLKGQSHEPRPAPELDPPDLGRAGLGTDR